MAAAPQSDSRESGVGMTDDSDAIAGSHARSRIGIEQWQIHPRHQPNQRSSSRRQSVQPVSASGLPELRRRKERKMLFLIAAFVFTLIIALLVGVEA